MDFLVDGVKLYAAVRGAGPAIVCLHGGFGLDHSYFLPGLAPLAAHHQLILLDLRGHGRGDPLPPESFRLEAISADLEAIRTQLGLEQWTVLGHSGGGIAAAHYLATHPARVRAFIIVGGFPEFPFEAPEWLHMARTLNRASINKGFEMFFTGVTTDDTYRDACIKIAPLFFADPVRADTSAFDRIIYRVAPFKEASRHYSGVNVGERVVGKTTPALILHGTNDYRVPECEARKWLTYLPHAEFHLVPDAGHFPWMDASAACCTAIEEFLAR